MKFKELEQEISKIVKFKEETGSKYAYRHIHNGGITFAISSKTQYIADELWETKSSLNIRATHFENLTNQMKFEVSPKGLRTLAKWLINEAELLESKPKIMDYQNHPDANDIEINEYK